MTAERELRDKLIGVLGENQVTTFTDTDGQRSMRLTKPDEQADALMPVVREALAQAWDDGHIDACGDCGELADRNPWRGDQP